MKHRLIKEYPGSPKLGTEVNYSETRKNYFYFRGILYTELPINQVEDLPEYWEKVVKKDYEILSFSLSNGLTTLRDNGRYLYERAVSDCYNGRGATLNEILNNEEFSNYKIHSVRRLSDGEIFTIGDVLELKGVCKKGKITEFKILKGKSDTEHSARIDRLLEKVDDKIGVAVDNYHIPTELLSELNIKPLFITEDGVEIYEGDKVYGIEVDGFKVFSGTVIKGNKLHKENWKFGKFSTKEAAEEHILMNKPCLSINNIQNKMFNIIGEPYYSNITIELKELVEQIIKKYE